MNDAIIVEHDRIYASDEGRIRRCDLYRPAAGTATGAAAILLHGGGWRAGSKAMMADMGAALARQGMLAVAAEYRLVTETPFPAALVDAKTCVRWLRANADALAVRADALLLVGFSAGAHLALLAAGTADSDRFPHGSEHAGVAEQVAGVAAFFPPVELDEGAAGRLGVPVTERAAVSPISYAAAGFPPTLLLHGTADTVIAHAASAAMATALAAAGVPVDLRLYADVPHEFIQLPGYHDLCARDIAHFIDRHVLGRDRFDAALADLNRFWVERRPAPAPAS